MNVFLKKEFFKCLLATSQKGSDATFQLKGERSSQSNLQGEKCNYYVTTINYVIKARLSQ